MQAEDSQNRRPGQFAPGNKSGKKFEKGTSGNPKGRPRGVRYVSEAFRFWLAAANEKDPKSSNADEIARIVGQAALAGDLKAIELLLKRTEGKERGNDGFLEPFERKKREMNVYRKMEIEGVDYAQAFDMLVDESLAAMQQAEREERRERREHARAARERGRQIAGELERLRIADEARRKAEELRREANDYSEKEIQLGEAKPLRSEEVYSAGDKVEGATGRHKDWKKYEREQRLERMKQTQRGDSLARRIANPQSPAPQVGQEIKTEPVSRTPGPPPKADPFAEWVRGKK